MSSLRIAVAPSVPIDRAEERIREIDPNVKVRVLPNAAALDDHLEWLQVVFGMISPAQMRRAPNLEWVQLNSSGFDPYLEFASSSVKITTARGVASAAAAEYVLGAMLMFTRSFPLFQRRQRERRWDRNIRAVGSLVSQSLGIVGFGANGTALAQRAKAMQMRVWAVKRTPANDTPPYVDSLSTMDGLADLLTECDHVAITLPLTKETRGLIGAEQVAMMKRGAYLYNLSRGGVVEEDAVLEALNSGLLAGAALDVFANEPVPPESPLWNAENLLVTPHLAAAWSGFWDAAFDVFRCNLWRFLHNEPLENLANLSRGY